MQFSPTSNKTDNYKSKCRIITSIDVKDDKQPSDPKTINFRPMSLHKGFQ